MHRVDSAREVEEALHRYFALHTDSLGWSASLVW